MVNDLLKTHASGAIISQHGGIMWLFDYTPEALNRIFKNIKYKSYWTDPVNNNIYIYL